MKRIVGITICILCATALRADDWPQWLGPRRDGTSLDKGLLDAFPKEGLKPIWERQVGEGFSGPLIKGERLILFHRIDNDEVVECLNAATGKGLWKFSYPTDYQDMYSKGNGPPPLIEQDLVLINVGAKQAGIVAFDLKSGQEVWKATNDPGSYSSPAIAT